MSWKTQLARAVSQLRVRERKLRAEIKDQRAKIEALEGMIRGKRRRRRLSEKGRAAISKAAEKRWRQYRAQKEMRSDPK